jgi:NADPH-dependent 2,4-dienoyl-CoA reductase/sulfur reductase-like enzyme
MKVSELYDVAVIGGGPAGLAAATAAAENGAERVLLIERDRILGGILNQCIHDGFGLQIFGEALSGPEYAERFESKLREVNVEVMTDTIVLELSGERKLKLSRRGEIRHIEAKAAVLAMGCRERTRGALSIPGDRPAGIYTAGLAQTLMNLENMMPGRRVCILGSGDVGLIMARRMTLEGAKVEAVFEIMPYPGGLERNIRQCLNDYNIPLYLGTTVVDIDGPDGRLQGVTVAEVDCERRPKAGTERYVPCDTLLISAGLIPENELTREAGILIDNRTQGAVTDDRCMTSVPGIFACGNVLHVHDLVDYVSKEGARAGAEAAKYAAGNSGEGADVEVKAGKGVRYTVPSKIRGGRDVRIAFRVAEPCRGKVIEARLNGKVIAEEARARLHPSEMVWLYIGSLEEGACGELEVGLR